MVIFACVVLLFIGMFANEHRMFRAEWPIFVPAAVLLFMAGGSLILRRLHDIGVPGWLAPLGLLPRAGWYYALLCVDVFRNDVWEVLALLLILLDIAALLVLVF